MTGGYYNTVLDLQIGEKNRAKRTRTFRKSPAPEPIRRPKYHGPTGTASLDVSLAELRRGLWSTTNISSPPAYHNNLGMAWRASGKLAEARACYGQALRPRIAASPLCDGRRHAAHLQNVLRGGW